MKLQPIMDNKELAESIQATHFLILESTGKANREFEEHLSLLLTEQARRATLMRIEEGEE